MKFNMLCSGFLLLFSCVSAMDSSSDDERPTKQIKFHIDQPQIRRLNFLAQAIESGSVQKVKQALADSLSYEDDVSEHYDFVVRNMRNGALAITMQQIHHCFPLEVIIAHLKKNS